jgi:UDP-glucose 4-epimerase
VRDVSAGVWALGEALVAGTLGAERVFNVGSAEEVTIAELAERVVRAAGGGRIERVPYEEAYGAGFEDMRRRVPDVAAMARAVDWRPTTSLDATIAELVELARGKNSRKA